jgi:hypothetical protein
MVTVKFMKATYSLSSRSECFSYGEKNEQKSTSIRTHTFDGKNNILSGLFPQEERRLSLQVLLWPAIRKERDVWLSCTFSVAVKSKRVQNIAYLLRMGNILKIQATQFWPENLIESSQLWDWKGYGRIILKGTLEKYVWEWACSGSRLCPMTALVSAALNLKFLLTEV